MTSDFELVRAVLSASDTARPTFDYLIAHALAAGFALVPRTNAVRSIELQWPDRRRNPFSVQVSPNHVNFYLRRPILAEHPELFAVAVARFGVVKSNSLDEYRTHLEAVDQAEAMLAFLREHGAWPDHRHAQRFVASTFAPIRGEHLLAAAQRLASGAPNHPFGASNDYDVLFDGRRLPPKAVFGHAAAAALGFPVRPANFSAGERTLSFRVLAEHGYPIVRKDEGDLGDPALVSDEDRVWTEGDAKLVTHLRRERGTGLASAKRGAFRAQHGRLFCERCEMDPVAVYGSDVGEACIEVHHRDIAVSEMQVGHQTRLDDLQCLCANCHRVTHRELKTALLARAPSSLQG
jgi:5-methylcytosine-specific restriction protein A